MTDPTLPIWLLAVLGPPSGGSVALVAIEPTSDDLFDALHKRMRRGGFSQVTEREWHTGAWGLSRTAAIDVVGGDLIRVTTGAASVYTGGPMPVTPRWLEAARARRALVALLPPGTLAGTEDAEAKKDRIGELAASRQLLGTMAPVRFDLPVSRPA